MENWQDLEEAYYPQSVKEKLDALGAAGKFVASDELWKNDLYQVNVRRGISFEGCPSLVTHLSIKLLTRDPVRDWRHFQWIKNQLVGEDCEGAELYPAESRMVDGSNQYHLWVLENPEARFPFGFSGGRMISERAMEGGKQRPWPDNKKPSDLKESEDMINGQLNNMGLKPLK